MEENLKFKSCKCGAIPQVIEIGKWPAQYRVDCTCGKRVIGPYYSHEESEVRHRSALKAVMEKWNSAN